jgi:hypothetical protein
MTNDNDLSNEARQEIQNAIQESEMNENDYRKEIEEIERNSGNLDLLRKQIFREVPSINDATIKISLNQSFEIAKKSPAGVYHNFVKPLSIVLYQLRQHSVDEFQDFANKFGNLNN